MFNKKKIIKLLKEHDEIYGDGFLNAEISSLLKIPQKKVIKILQGDKRFYFDSENPKFIGWRYATCKDAYGKILKVGDKVIPMCSEACILDIRGEVKAIYHSNGYDWIDIYDFNKNELIKKWNAQYFSTQERLDELG